MDQDNAAALEELQQLRVVLQCGNAAGAALEEVQRRVKRLEGFVMALYEIRSALRSEERIDVSRSQVIENIALKALFSDKIPRGALPEPVDRLSEPQLSAEEEREQLLSRVAEVFGLHARSAIEVSTEPFSTLSERELGKLGELVEAGSTEPKAIAEAVRDLIGRLSASHFELGKLAHAVGAVSSGSVVEQSNAIESALADRVRFAASLRFLRRELAESHPELCRAIDEALSVPRVPIGTIAVGPFVFRRDLPPAVWNISKIERSNTHPCQVTVTSGSDTELRRVAALIGERVLLLSEGELEQLLRK